jgi:hypothetical protein
MQDKPKRKAGNPNWAKGVGGNPSGRPKKAMEFQILMQEHSALAIQTLLDVLKTGKNAEKLTAAQEVLNRAYGKAVQATVNTQVKSFEAMLDVLAGTVTQEEIEENDLHAIVHGRRTENGAASLH